MERRNIVDEDLQERVSAEAAILNSRLHYYGRLTGSSDRLLVPLTPSHPVFPEPGTPDTGCRSGAPASRSQTGAINHSMSLNRGRVSVSVGGGRRRAAGSSCSRAQSPGVSSSRVLRTT